LVSIGGVQSNHTRQVAAVAAKLGLKCRLVQEKWVDWDDPVNDRVGNILLSRIMGADVRLDPSSFDIGIRSSWENALREVQEAGGTPYGIPAGASEHPLGGLGFANWAFEVAEQEKQLGVYFDTIIVCTVTGSTHAGMIAGFAALQETADSRPRRLIGIDASATLDKTRDQVARIASHTAKLIELGRDLREDETTVLEGWAGDHYGIPVKSTVEAIKLCGSLEGMIIDPVYEGKSMAGLIDLVTSREIPEDSTVLYAHLGGQPALNAYSGIFD
jgi:1-aminocyclopropane-1-carboxylate deaminase